VKANKIIHSIDMESDVLFETRLLEIALQENVRVR
jgi:hypothetical protein